MTKEYQSTSIENLSKALAKAQAEMDHAHKGSENPFFKSKYADLPTVINSIREQLSKNEISFTQITDFDESGMFVVTQLSCGNEWIRGYYPINPTKQDPQGFGSAVTYARRYALQAIVGISASEDDDGNASIKQSPFKAAAARKEYVQNILNQFNELEDTEESTIEELDRIRKAYNNFDALKDTDNEHDGLALDEIRKQYRIKKDRVESMVQMQKQLEA